MTRRWPATALTFVALWLFVRGVELAPARLAEEAVAGLLVGLPIAYATRRFYDPEFPVSHAIRAVPYALLYLLAFLLELFTANVDVARRVLAPSMPMDPEVIRVPLRVRTDFAITTIANTISLTPGALTMDYDARTNSLYVHSIDAGDRESVLEPIRRWEDYALVIFDEEYKPGDPVPGPDEDEPWWLREDIPPLAPDEESSRPYDPDARPSREAEAPEDDGESRGDDEGRTADEGGEAAGESRTADESGEAADESGEVNGDGR